MGYHFFKTHIIIIGCQVGRVIRSMEWKLENKLPAAEFFFGVYESQRSSSSTWRQFNLDKAIPDYLD